MGTVFGQNNDLILRSEIQNMKKILHSLLLCILWIICHSTVHAQEVRFRIVVNPANNITTLDQKVLADIFLKKTTFWPDMKNILVVDLASTSPVRRQFSEQVLEKPISAVRNYWQQLLFSGREVPPPELKNDEEMVSFVSTHENAIGYVSGNADLRGLKTIRIR